MSETKKKEGLFVFGTCVAVKETNSGGAMVTLSVGHSLPKVFFAKEQLNKIPELYTFGQFELKSSDNGFLGVL